MAAADHSLAALNALSSTPCHPERSNWFAQRSSCAVEGHLWAARTARSGFKRSRKTAGLRRRANHRGPSTPSFHSQANGKIPLRMTVRWGGGNHRRYRESQEALPFLRNGFAPRSSDSVQDDRPKRNVSASGKRLAHSLSLWVAPSSILTRNRSSLKPARRRMCSRFLTSFTTC